MYPKAVFPSEAKNTIAVDPSRCLHVKEMREVIGHNRTTGPLSGRGIILPEYLPTAPPVKVTWKIVESEGLVSLVAITE